MALKTQLSVKHLAAVCLLGAVAGIFVVWPRHQRLLDDVARLEAQLQEARGEIVALKAAQTKAARAAPTPVRNPAAPRESVSAPAAENTAAPTPVPLHAPPDNTEFRVNARLSALQKFVPISEAQRDELRRRFEEQILAGDRTGSDPIIEEVLGKENAEFYRNERQRAFDRAEEESREKDTLLLSRRLQLSPDQEQRLRLTFESVDRQLRMQRAGNENASVEARMKAMVEENRARQQLLNEQLREIFSEEQYRQYLEQNADTTEGNLEVWHGE